MEFLPSTFDIRYSLFYSFFFDQTDRFFGQRRRSCETSSGYGKIKVGPTTLARHTQGV
jgi:hypothetical protein